MSYFSITQGDREPIVRAELSDASGAINLNASTCYWVYRHKYSGVAPTSGLATVLEDGTGGLLEYSWGANDTNLAGVYYGYWKISGQNGWSTYPNDSPLKYVINPNL